ncbi:MAG: response regulator [Candidatus Brocadiales bacterium]|nr:response regulator [Candidatus Brocadiales bacterium]
MSKILIVDDEVKACNLLKRFLEADENEYEIMTSHSGEDALEKVKSFKPTLMLLDIKMPGMDGMEVLRQVRKFDKDVGIIMLTAIIDKDVADEAFRMGADDYISKPVQISFLESRIFLDIMAKKLIRRKYRDKDSDEISGDDYFG